MKKRTLLLLFLLSFISVIAIGQEQISEAAPASKKFTSEFLGGLDLITFLALFVWALIGMVINLLSDMTRRNKQSPKTPEKVSGKFYWQDNWRRIALSVLLIPIAIVGCKEVFGVEVSPATAFGIGFGSDHIMEILKRKGILKRAESATEQEAGN